MIFLNKDISRGLEQEKRTYEISKSLGRDFKISIFLLSILNISRFQCFDYGFHNASSDFKTFEDYYKILSDTYELAVDPLRHTEQS